MGSDCAKVQDGYGYCADCEQLGELAAFKNENARLDDELTQLRTQLAEVDKDRDGWKKLWGEATDSLVDANQQLAKMREALTAVPSILYGLGMVDVRKAEVAQLAIEVCRAALERKDA